MVVSWIEWEELQFRTHRLRWLCVTASLVVIASVAPFLFPLYWWPIVTGLCSLVAFSRFAVLAPHAWLSRQQWIEREELEMKTHPLRWYSLTAAAIALAGIAPLLGGIWFVATGVCGLVALFRLAVLVRVRLSGKRGRQGHTSGKRETDQSPR